MKAPDPPKGAAANRFAILSNFTDPRPRASHFSIFAEDPKMIAILRARAVRATQRNAVRARKCTRACLARCACVSSQRRGFPCFARLQNFFDASSARAEHALIAASDNARTCNVLAVLANGWSLENVSS